MSLQSRKFVRTLGALAISLSFAACASDDDGEVDGNVTAADAGADITPDPTIDAAPTPTGGSNLAAMCQPALCSGVAVDCLSPTGPEGPGMCSMSCGTDVIITTNAQGQVPLPTDTALHAVCAADYQGVGTPACAIMVGGANPLPAPPAQPVPDTAYTVNLSCGVLCEQGSNACPTGLTCNGGLCMP